MAAKTNCINFTGPALNWFRCFHKCFVEESNFLYKGEFNKTIDLATSRVTNNRAFTGACFKINKNGLYPFQGLQISTAADGGLF